MDWSVAGNPASPLQVMLKEVLLPSFEPTSKTYYLKKRSSYVALLTRDRGARRARKENRCRPRQAPKTFYSFNLLGIPFAFPIVYKQETTWDIFLIITQARQLFKMM